MRCAVILLSSLLFVGCQHCLKCHGISASQSVARFAAAGAPPVDSGRYPGPLQILPSDHPLLAGSAQLRADVEAHERILRQLLRDRISVRSPLEFRFMYAGRDSLNHKLVLRYFSRAADQREFAGWQVQLVYSLPSMRPEHAYVQAVPLE